MSINLNSHWNLIVSRDTDTALRQFFVSQGKKFVEDLSQFVEEAVRIHLLDLAAITTKTKNAIYFQEDIENAIEEALLWAKQ